METFTIVLSILAGLLSIVLFFGIWSYRSDPKGFMKAFIARISLCFINIGALSKAIATTLLSGVYVIFDPIPIVIDDVLVIAIATGFISRTLTNMAKASSSFPKPWRT